MKLLFTNHRLAARGGSELFTAEVTAELIERGHDVAIFSTVGGPFADGLREAGHLLLNDPAACPFTPDLIHGQHHLETMAALSAWPGTPGLYFLHGYGPEEERPPSHPRLLRYAAPSSAFLPWLEARCGVPADHVHLIRNFFDPAKFPVRRPTVRPLRRALIYHNTVDPSGPICAAITAACAEAGLSLETAGASFGRVLQDPGLALPEYDVIFASGRSALESIACGCAVVPINKEQTGRWISPDHFGEALDLNFTLRPDGPTHAVPLTEVLSGIRAEGLPAMADHVRRTLTLSTAVDHLETAYEEVLGLPVPCDPVAESTALAAYLTSLAAIVKQSDANRDSLIHKRDEATRRGERWKEKAEQLRNKLESIQSMLENGPWWYRRLWRRLRRSL